MELKTVYLIHNEKRFGHVFFEPWCALHDQYERRHEILVGLKPTDKLGNSFSVELISRYFNVSFMKDYKLFWKTLVESNQYRTEIDSIEFMRWDNAFFEKYMLKMANGYKNPFQYSFNDEDIARGREIQSRIGIPEGARFICVHGRESGWIPRLSYHSFRDSDIYNLLPAIEYLLEQGFWIVRIGDPSMKKLPQMERVIDLPFHPERTDFADIWLIVNSHFMICTTSGPVAIPLVFGKPPRLILNYTLENPPFLADYRDIFVPKSYYSKKMRRLLNMRETLFPGVISGRAEDYEKNSIDVIENRPDDILRAVREMLDSMDMKREDLYAHELQQRCKSSLSEVHASKSIAGNGEPFYYVPLRISTSFLESHPELIG